jgi:predicted transposase/invertase (TIGR01784 family)
MKFVNPKNDVAFKKIFGNENKKEILISFLNAVLDLRGVKEIAYLSILNTSQTPQLLNLKSTTLDVRAVDKRGITFIVEMQVERKPYLRQRFTYYVAKSYVSQIDKGDDYTKLNKVVFIGVFDFNEFENEHYLSRHMILNCETLEPELRDLEFNFIELPKFTKEVTELKTILDKWVYFIKHAVDLDVVPAHATETPALQTAYEVADRLNWSKRELEVMEYWEIRDRGDRAQLEESVKAAEQAKTLEIARSMLAEGIEPAIIAKITGLSEDDISQCLG